MKKTRAEELWQDKLTGEISQEEEKELNDFLKSNPTAAQELKGLEQTWELFNEIERPEPSTQMDARFEGMLAAYQSSKSRSNPFIGLVGNWLARSWQVGLASLVLGLFIGWWMLPSQNQSKSINELSSEIQSMKEMMMLTLIEQPKAQERIRAVNLAADLPSADEKVINALITTLNNDVNVNVRIAALESLLKYSDQPEIRSSLIESLKIQKSPLMLVAIADALVTIQEKSSIEAMKQLKDSIEDGFVKDKLNESIETLTTI